MDRSSVSTSYTDHDDLLRSQVDLVENQVTAALQHEHAQTRSLANAHLRATVRAFRQAQHCAVELDLKQARSGRPVLVPPGRNRRDLGKCLGRDDHRVRTAHATTISKPLQDRAKLVERDAFAVAHRRQRPIDRLLILSVELDDRRGSFHLEQ